MAGTVLDFAARYALTTWHINCIFNQIKDRVSMKSFLPAFFLFCVHITTSYAQTIICSSIDRTRLNKKIVEIQGIRQPSYGDTLATIGKSFLGTPYVAKTLEIGEKESLVINLQGLDCTTYVENVLALGILLSKGAKSLDTFAAALLSIRYRDGELKGYPSRLHYFSEWIANNDKKGLVCDVTADLGGKPITKDINFMSTHRDLYPFLADDDNYLRIKASERYLNNRPVNVLAKDKIEASEHLIQTGDVIALATSIEGLDVTHTGFAIRLDSGRIHLLHASSSNEEVEISRLPLADYLKEIRHNTGIMVARPL
jgi:hypothetical protein